MGDTRRRKLPVILAVLAALALGFAAPASASFTSLAPAPPIAAPTAAPSLTASVEVLAPSLGMRPWWSRTPTGPRSYFGARYYGSKIGRFTTTDPVYTWRENLVDPQRWNRYAYARNNPLRYVDPDGKIPVDTIWDVGNVLYDIYTGVKTGNWTDLGADALAMAIPYVPAGASKLRHLNKLDDAADLLKAGDKAGDAARVVDSKAGKRAFSTKDRDAAFEKAKDAQGVPRCEYCEGDLVKPKGSRNSYEADHRDPWVKSRDSSPENLATSCRSCNREKGAKTVGDQWVPPKERQQ